MICAVWLALAVLPERVDVKTSTASFAAKHELAVHEGRIWWRDLPGGAARTWVLLPPDGLPVGHGGRLEKLKKAAGLSSSRFEPPARIDAISADGDNLVAWGPSGRVYYAKLDTLEWPTCGARPEAPARCWSPASTRWR
jgi:hypothetical protein